MNVLILEDSSKVGMGGGQRVTLELIEILGKQGATVNLLDHTSDSLFLDEARKFDFVRLAKEKHAGVRYKVGGASSSAGLKPLLDGILKTASSISFVLHTVFAGKRYDIVYCPTRSNIMTFLALKLFRRSRFQVFHIHSFYQDTTVKRGFLWLLKSKRIKILVPSAFMAGDLSRYGLDATVLPNPVATPSRPLPSHDGRILKVGFFGGEMRWKGYDLFQEISRILVMEKGVEPDEIVSYSLGHTEQNPAHRVNRTSKKLVDDLCDVRVCLVPSLSEESFCIAAVEAANAGCCILYRPIGALSEVLDDYPLGIALNSTDPRAWAEAIVESLYKGPSADIFTLTPRCTRTDFETTVGTMVSKC